MIKFFIPMVPPTMTSQQKGINFTHRRVFEKTEITQIRELFRSRVAQHKPTNRLTGPIRLLTKWLWPCGKSYRNGEYKVTKPDTDNSLKLLKDAMTDVGYWIDDSQVASEVTEKFWAEIPGIYVEVEQL